MKYRLPLLVEQSVQETQARRSELAASFEQQLRSNAQISCRKGCHHCCSYPVMMSILEGVHLFRWLSNHDLWTRELKAKFETTHAQTWGLAIEVWLLASIPCPLLDNGTCSAYDARPSTCRVTFSTGDPYYCHPHRFGEENAVVPRRDILESIASMEENILWWRHRIRQIRVPLATAVLFGERICKGEFDLDSFNERLLTEHAQRG